MPDAGWFGAGQVYIIEANPRASRTVPFVAKAVGHPIVKYASLLMAGKTLPEIGFTEEPTLNHVAVKEAVLPFDKFPGPPSRHSSPLSGVVLSLRLHLRSGVYSENFIIKDCAWVHSCIIL